MVSAPGLRRRLHRIFCYSSYEIAGSSSAPERRPSPRVPLTDKTEGAPAPDTRALRTQSSP